MSSSVVHQGSSVDGRGALPWCGEISVWTTHLLQDAPDVVGRAVLVKQPGCERALEQQVDEDEQRVDQVDAPVVDDTLVRCGGRCVKR